MWKTLTTAFYLAAVLQGCGTPAETQNAYDAIRKQANEVVQMLAHKDWQKLSKVVHPVNGLRFSPYVFVDLDSDVVLSAEKVADLGSDKHERLWGTFDGSGEPIQLTFDRYYARFVYDRDFVSVAAGSLNALVARGNTVNNIAEVYAGRDIVFLEYFVPGTEEFGGMDWRSVRLVFERDAGHWYLIGIVHDQWTI